MALLQNDSSEPLLCIVGVLPFEDVNLVCGEHITGMPAPDAREVHLMRDDAVVMPIGSHVRVGRKKLVEDKAATGIQNPIRLGCDAKQIRAITPAQDAAKHDTVHFDVRQCHGGSEPDINTGESRGIRNRITGWIESKAAHAPFLMGDIEPPPIRTAHLEQAFRPYPFDCGQYMVGAVFGDCLGMVPVEIRSIAAEVTIALTGKERGFLIHGAPFFGESN